MWYLQQSICGSTGRSFGIRMKKHYVTFQSSNTEKSAYVITENHTFTPDYKILYLGNKGKIFYYNN